MRSVEQTDAAQGLLQVGDADLSVIGAALADKGRCKILLALADGRALPASVLAGEAGVSAATASTHLRKLCDAGLLHVVRKGRWLYFRLAGDEVGELIETLARLSPTQPILSLREGTRATRSGWPAGATTTSAGASGSPSQTS
ncbi:MAG: hypothetical protein QOJ06_1661 [Pseudonocardiales bacterium]|jgi:DNA-binding transcriptional ArsR family regulator|nr:hypothetical protein [Pseudonocardiales bacterium]